MSTEKTRLVQLCQGRLKESNLDDKYEKRLNKEIKEIENQGMFDYFLDLFDQKLSFTYNENNLLVPYLLGLCPDFNIDQPAAHVQGEAPDVDVDMLPKVRDHVKNVWAPATFGADNVCSISTYGTLGIKMALLDCTKVYGLPKDEIQAITKSMEDKDDDGKPITWQTAFEMYPALKDYCGRFPDIAELAKALTHRNKSGGVHAGGLIISNQPIADFVPLEVRKVTKDNKYGVVVSAWTEGLANQDLQPVGLIKYDLLVVDGLEQVAVACKLIRERHGIDKICALPDGRSWSDLAFLDDPKALTMANKGDLQCIFQFTSEGIRKLAKRSGVTCFDDIVTITSLYRPAALTTGMANAYCERKRGNEEYTVHPSLESALGYTYGVMAFQEQVMQVLNVVGDIPLIHCEKIRKAISKKKVEQFVKYKEMFLTNGQKILGESLDYVTNLWKQIEAFAGYGFNRSHAVGYSYITAKQIYLKAHYPLEFYTSMFMCEDDHQKLKQYRLDANKHGIDLLPVDINKSKQNFAIVDEKIYYGFSKLKGLGEAASDRLVANQPYVSLEDCLDKVGAEAKVFKPLIALEVFGQDKVKLYKTYQKYKNTQKREKGALAKASEIQETLLEVLKSHCVDPEIIKKCANFDAVDLWRQHFYDIEVSQPYNYRGEERIRKVTVYKLLLDLKGRFERKPKETDPNKLKLDETFEKFLEIREAEKAFYGFQWKHELEESPDYEGHTIDLYHHELEKGGNSCIEVKVLEIKKKDFKSGKGHAFDVKVEDADSKEIKIKFWSDDYYRFEEEIVVGNLLRMRVKPPFGMYATYSFESVPKWRRWKELAKDKEDDCRLVVLEKK